MNVMLLPLLGQRCHIHALSRGGSRGCGDAFTGRLPEGFLAGTGLGLTPFNNPQH